MCSHEVTQKDLHDLLDIFERKSFEAGTCEQGTAESFITSKCELLFKLDYSLIELDNANGILSPRYPGRIFIPEYEHGHMAATITASNSNVSNGSVGATTTLPQAASSNGHHSNGSGIHAYVTFANPLQQPPPPSAAPPLSAVNIPPYPSHHYNQQLHNHHLQQQQQQQPAQPQMPLSQSQSQSQLQQQQPPQQSTIYEDLYDIGKIRELITLAKYARCRRRFAVPVIMFRGKYICRSATISVMPETYGRKVVDYAYDCLNGTNYAEQQRATVNDDDETDSTDDSLIAQISEPSQFSYDEAIKSDIQLLKALNVSTIVDLMVEKRKIKYFMTVSSSEKADPENHYENFNILSLPYPGCEFFKKFRDNNYIAKNLFYDWQQSFNDAAISIPNLGPANELDICWYDYKKWDLVAITQNYLKATLKYIQEENSGLLIHCISGWDRTPLFVSLVRLSLWADGLIHQSLNALQMAYFTVAYDWYLFGHQLPDRLRRGEDIMFFCFHILKFITDEEFSVIEHRKRTKTSSSSGSSSVIVIRSDCCDDEPLKEEYVLNFDQDSNDSFSNSSNCDMTDSFYTTTTTTTQTQTIIAPGTAAGTAATAAVNNVLISRSPNPKRSKTSPISVPGAAANGARQRQESASSNGSWQVVTDTGSIDSTVNGSYMMRFVAQQQHDNSMHMVSGNGGGYFGSGGSGGSTSTNTSSSISGNGSTQSNGSGLGNGPFGTRESIQMPPVKVASGTLRKQRLNSVRAIFIQAYGKTVGMKFKDGSTINLSNFIGTLAEQLF